MEEISKSFKTSKYLGIYYCDSYYDESYDSCEFYETVFIANDSKYDSLV